MYKEATQADEKQRLLGAVCSSINKGNIMDTLELTLGPWVKPQVLVQGACLRWPAAGPWVYCQARALGALARVVCSAAQ